jgi:multicomponent Na+:H+ antiporter subunit B
MALVWMRLNAVDVAFTEASVGAGITTVLIIATLSRTARMEEGGGGRIESVSRGLRKAHVIMRLVPIVVVVAIAGVLVYGTMDMPDFGDPEAPAHHHVADRYIEEGHHETASVNLVTGVLANYRGYDTLGETTVIFTAGLGVLLLLRRKRR